MERGNHNEDDLHAGCYRNSLKLAVKNGIKSIAFPAISTGVYSFPLERATKIALDEVTKFLIKNDEIEKVIIVCFDDVTYNIYQRAFKLLFS